MKSFGKNMKNDVKNQTVSPESPENFDERGKGAPNGAPDAGAHGKGGRPKMKINKQVMPRLLKVLFKNYWWQLIIVGICLIISAAGMASGGIFIQNVVEAIKNQDWNEFINVLIVMACVCGAAVIAIGVRSYLMAGITQGFLCDVRDAMFNKMQNLPIKYFDTHTHGDIMSVYSNDVDTLRQLVSESLLAIVQTTFTVLILLFMMLFYSVWLTLIVGLFVVLMMVIVKKIGGNSAKYFVKQQKSLGECEGFVEESMNGQKVIKVFTHERLSEEQFDKVNGKLVSDATKANTYANILMPMMGNLGHLLYVVLALVGTVIAVSETALPAWFTHFSISGKLLDISIIVAFLPMSKNFTQNIANVTQQVNSIFMGLAGAQRVFDIIDAEPEVDEGYVTLVNAIYDENGNLTETPERTGLWAWKHPHKAEGTVTYTPLKGDIVMDDVDFGYDPNKIVLHDVSLYAHQGQKVAFVGATGAGKTTITNLLNRFYDIADGKIRYDGININKIKKDDLRRSLGMVLQDTNLFTGTVMENIRYGRLDATDEECIAAAKLANAHDFISRLPEGYNTMLTADGANLSQGQRQLLSIARAAVKDAPVMIMDEATSSIDTRTELLVQQGTDELMKGRTVFVIAHRLSTVQNSDVIMVLDHGVVIERGSHEELIARRGKYYQLYTGAFELE